MLPFSSQLPSPRKRTAENPACDVKRGRDAVFRLRMCREPWSKTASRAGHAQSLADGPRAAFPACGHTPWHGASCIIGLTAWPALQRAICLPNRTFWTNLDTVRRLGDMRRALKVGSVRVGRQVNEPRTARLVRMAIGSEKCRRATAADRCHASRHGRPGDSLARDGVRWSTVAVLHMMGDDMHCGLHGPCPSTATATRGSLLSFFHISTQLRRARAGPYGIDLPPCRH